MPTQTGLWQMWANFGLAALVTGFVLWRVDTKLASALKKLNMILLLCMQMVQINGIDIDESKLVGMLRSNGK